VPGKRRPPKTWKSTKSDARQEREGPRKPGKAWNRIHVRQEEASENLEKYEIGCVSGKRGPPKTWKSMESDACQEREGLRKVGKTWNRIRVRQEETSEIPEKQNIGCLPDKRKLPKTLKNKKSDACQANESHRKSGKSEKRMCEKHRNSPRIREIRKSDARETDLMVLLSLRLYTKKYNPQKDFFMQTPCIINFYHI